MRPVARSTTAPRPRMVRPLCPIQAGPSRLPHPSPARRSSAAFAAARSVPCRQFRRISVQRAVAQRRPQGRGRRSGRSQVRGGVRRGCLRPCPLTTSDAAAPERAITRAVVRPCGWLSARGSPRTRRSVRKDEAPQPRLNEGRARIAVPRDPVGHCAQQQPVRGETVGGAKLPPRKGPDSRLTQPRSRRRRGFRLPRRRRWPAAGPSRPGTGAA